jgi:hypothetical protein
LSQNGALTTLGGFIGSLTGNADTATALAANPTACSAGQYVTDLDANGTLTCGVPAGSQGYNYWNLATNDLYPSSTSYKLGVGTTTLSETFGVKGIANLWPFRVASSSGAYHLSLSQVGLLTSSGGFSGALTGNVTGNADTATNLAANPPGCAAGEFTTDISANGSSTCGIPPTGTQAYNYWGLTTNDLYPSSTVYKLGLGTTTHDGTLTVKGIANITPFQVASSTGTSLLKLVQNGYFGIGTSTPVEALSVQGNIIATGNLRGITQEKKSIILENASSTTDANFISFGIGTSTLVKVACAASTGSTTIALIRLDDTALFASGTAMLAANLGCATEAQVTASTTSFAISSTTPANSIGIKIISTIGTPTTTKIILEYNSLR